MGKGSGSTGALVPLRPVSELLDHLTQVTGGPVDAALLQRHVVGGKERNA